MAAQKPQYVTRLTKAKCTFGSMSQYLNLPEDHGVWFHSQDTPIMNANDHEPNKHILHFGRCTSSKNPSNSLFNMEDMVINGVLNCLTGGMFGIYTSLFGSQQLKKMLGCEGCKCKPMTITPWKNVDDDYYIEGAPAITQNSYLNCYYGGKIEIDLSEEDAESDEKSSAEIEEKAYDSRLKMPSSMVDKLNEFCNGNEDTSSAFSDVVAAGEAGSYGVSPETSAENYRHNKQQSIPSGATDSNGNIVDQSAMGNYRIGNTTLADQGEGVLAAYNIINMVLGNPNLSNIIQFFEILPFILGTNMLGKNTYGFVALLIYLIAQNLEVSLAVKKEKTKKTEKTGKIGKMKSSTHSRTGKVQGSIHTAQEKMVATTKAAKTTKSKQGKVAVKGTMKKYSDKTGERHSVARINPVPTVETKESMAEKLEDEDLMILVGKKEDNTEEQA